MDTEFLKALAAAAERARATRSAAWETRIKAEHTCARTAELRRQARRLRARLPALRAERARLAGRGGEGGA
jgi:hypothetical protein